MDNLIVEDGNVEYRLDGRSRKKMNSNLKTGLAVQHVMADIFRDMGWEVDALPDMAIDADPDLRMQHPKFGVVHLEVQNADRYSTEYGERGIHMRKSKLPRILQKNGYLLQNNPDRVYILPAKVLDPLPENKRHPQDGRTDFTKAYGPFPILIWDKRGRRIGYWYPKPFLQIHGDTRPDMFDFKQIEKLWTERKHLVTAQSDD